MKFRTILEDILASGAQKELEEDYPTNWDVEEFKKLTSFSQRVQYCQDRLQRISSGSARIVYKIDDTKVLKLAKNKKGLAQNQTEIDFSNDYMWDGIVAEIIESDENALWVEMELARKVTPKIFQEVTGVEFDNFCDAIRYYDHQHNGGSTRSLSYPKPDNYDDLWENEFCYEMLNIIGSYDLPVGDLCRLSTYGVVNREDNRAIVMIDYGLTKSVYDSYYK
jgi:hypothetical protein